ncbi:hypothetical protein ONZ45_g1146 [Pleurotus djamor]|nr:hypothetical protein ONZ45_g1146 [Pleurotus djamor]
MIVGVPFLAALLSVAPSTFALRAPLVRRTDGFLSRRHNGEDHGHSAPPNTSDHHHTVYLHNEHDLPYGINITIGGQDIILNLDTRSSDLWVYHPDIQVSNSAAVTANLSYGDGYVSGPVDFTTIEFAGDKVPSQAFIHVNETVHQECLENTAISGVIGLGLNCTASIVSTVLEKSFGVATTFGRSLIGNIFYQNQFTGHGNYFTLLYGRTDVDLKEKAGIFTISEIAEGYEAIVDAPKLKSPLPDYWSVVIDGMRMGNQTHPFATVVPGLPEGQGAAVVDTGYSTPWIPQHCVDWIYGALPGAVSVYDAPEFQAIGANWLFPCNEMQDVVLMIGGIEYPLHPLDLSKMVTVPLNGQNTTFCYNLYQNYPEGVSWDLILGDPFLKSVYISYNHGSMDASGAHTEDRYVQILSTTTLDKARKEFDTIRAKQLSGLKEISPSQVKELVKKDPSSLKAIVSHPIPYSGEHSHSPPSSPSGSSSSGSHSHSASDSGSHSHSDVASNVAGGVFAAGINDANDYSAVTAILDKYSPVVIGLLGGILLMLVALTGLGAYFCISRRGKCTTTKMMTMSYHPVKMGEAKDAPQMEPFAGRYDDA